MKNSWGAVLDKIDEEALSKGLHLSIDLNEKKEQVMWVSERQVFRASL